MSPTPITFTPNMPIPCDFFGSFALPTISLLTPKPSQVHEDIFLRGVEFRSKKNTIIDIFWLASTTRTDKTRNKDIEITDFNPLSKKAGGNLSNSSRDIQDYRTPPPFSGIFILSHRDLIRASHLIY